MSGPGGVTGARGPMARAALATLVPIAIAGAALVAITLVRDAVVPEPLERLSATQLADGRTRWDGSWHFPRGGPYILGFDSRTPARLSIDGKVVAAGQGQVSRRVVFEAGIKALSFEADREGSRLLWHPPGRRGPLEYVPPSSLSPLPPERAVFDRWAGAAPMDGVFAGLAVLVLLGLGLYLGRRALARAHRGTAAAFLAIAAVALAIRLYDLNAAGQTWDEDVNWSAGRNYVTNLLARDFSEAAWTWNYEHPPVMKYIAGLGAQWADGYGPARALSALVMALGCALLVPIGRRLYSLPVGVMAGLIAAASPHLVAHGKIVGHEAPTVLLWALGIWLSLTVHDPPGTAPEPYADRTPEPAPAAAPVEDIPGGLVARRLAVLGVVIGLALMSRFVNGLLAPLCGALVLMTAPRGRRLRMVGLGMAIVPAAAVLTAVLVWPRLWSEPIAHLLESWAKLRTPHAPEAYLGAITNQPPWHYFPVYLVATAPLGVLAGALAWVVRVVAWRGHGERMATAVVLVWLAVPMVVILSPVRQDGVRYVMPCLLALALAGAAGADFLASVLGRALSARFAWFGSTRLRAALGMGMAVYLALVLARIHPYYLDYYGEHVGGPAGVARARWFEIAWWGEGLDRAVAYINREAAPRARVFKRCIEPAHLTWLRGDLWATEAQRATDAEWILSYQPHVDRCPPPANAELVYEVVAQGAPLVRVYRMTANTKFP